MPIITGNGSRGIRSQKQSSPWIGRELTSWFQTYLVLPPHAGLVMSTWMVASYLMEVWDRFPHLAITSPEKRCGKTLTLELLAEVAHQPRFTTGISPAVLYRLIQQEQPTLLLDEAQVLGKRGSENNELLKDLLKAGTERESVVHRCGGKNMDEIMDFRVYGPKVFALIGTLDGTLADRCLPVALRRKLATDQVQRYRKRLVAETTDGLRSKLTIWAEQHQKILPGIYDTLEPFPIDNDRMAEMLLPLMTVLLAAKDREGLKSLEEFAHSLDERDRQLEAQSPGVRLLLACREIYRSTRDSFLPTDDLLLKLLSREDEPWATWNHGEPLSREALANLLRPYGIKSYRKNYQSPRGYGRDSFTDSWARYLPLQPS